VEVKESVSIYTASALIVGAGVA